MIAGLQSHNQDDPKLLDTKVPILLYIYVYTYADDIVLLSQSPSGLQKRLNVLQLSCAEKLLSVNMSETQVVILTQTVPKNSCILISKSNVAYGLGEVIC